MKRKITSLLLLLAMLVSIVAVLPVAASAEEETNLVGTDVTLADGILLNFYIEADESLGVTNATLVDKNGKKCYKITKELAAKEMGDVVAAQLMSGASAVGEVYFTTVAEYAAGILDGDYSEETKALVTAMLSYGAAAQKYFKYGEDDLVGTPVTDTSALKAADVADVEVADEADLFVGASLVLEGTMKLRFYFFGNNLAVTADGEAVEVVNVGEDVCYADVAVTPDNIDKVYTVVTGDTVVKYSALNYLKNTAENENKAHLHEIVASIYAYSVATEAYVSACTHEETAMTTVKLPTAFTTGVEEGICPVCGEKVSAELPTTKIELNTVDTLDTKNTPYGTANIGKALGDKEFGPENDLYLEFSFLFNYTLQDLAGSGIGFGHIANMEDVTKESEALDKSFSWLYYKPSAEWCPFVGGFEFSESKKFSLDGGETWKTYKKNNNNADDFAIAEGDYGWHRIGLKYHQNVYRNGNDFTYDVTVFVYVDGVEVAQVVQNWGAYFYSAELVDDDVVYTQNPDIADKYAVFYRVGSAALLNKENKDDPELAYAPFADCYLTVGDGFVLNAVPVNSTVAAPALSPDGAAITGRQYFAFSFDECAHSNCDFLVQKLPTAYEAGMQAGFCTDCNEYVTVELPATKANLNLIDAETSSDNASREIVNIGDVLGDKEFSPDNDLYVEFSVFFNDTMQVLKGQAIGVGNFAVNGYDAHYEKYDDTFAWLYYKSSAEWCPFVGGFEFSESKKFSLDGGETWKTYKKNNNNADDFAIAEGSDGWHRIGFKYHQNVYRNGSDFTYDVTVFVYIDGVEVAQVIQDWGAYFYSAELVDGDVVYTQNPDIADMYAVVYRAGNGWIPDKSQGPAYVPVADCYVTVGDGFVLDVEPVENPKRQEFTQDGVTLTGKQYFEVIVDPDSTAGDPFAQLG